MEEIIPATLKEKLLTKEVTKTSTFATGSSSFLLTWRFVDRHGNRRAIHHDRFLSRLKDRKTLITVEEPESKM